MSGSFDDDAEVTVSINEYIESMEAEELEADMVLGGDEGDECTYMKGFMKRQAIFSCMTCTPAGDAGVCTACCLSCHDGHELLELWTKRNFRCDCGNSKFGAFACKLFSGKDVENTENSYNHNFKGLYCTCNRPYPDPDVEEQVDMIQCCICEDWFHEEHLGLEPSKISSVIPRDEEGEPMYEDFICRACSASCSFLTFYPQNLWVAGREECVAPAVANGEKVVLEKSNSECESMEDKATISADTAEKAQSGPGESSEKSSCVLGADWSVESANFECRPLFLSKNWRGILCRCERCLDMYKQKNVRYLVDSEDTIAEYEKRAQQKRTEKLQQQEDETSSMFENLDHVAKMEILHGIKDFKEEFRGLLESAGPSKTITAADIQQMFDNLKNKRRRIE